MVALGYGVANFFVPSGTKWRKGRCGIVSLHPLLLNVVLLLHVNAEASVPGDITTDGGL